VEYQAPYYRTWAAVLLRYTETSRRPDAAQLAGLRTAITAFSASSARLRLPFYLWLLASSYGKAGLIEDGLAVVDEGLAVSRESNERWWDAELHRLRGRLTQAHGGNENVVEAELLEAADVARTQCARSLELRAAMSLARWWSGRNRRDDARRQLSAVYDWFTEGFDTPDLRAARTVLAELA
ncbi:MAG: hypothetical protein ACRDHE_05780, partial [Ktedonobacterales bacterium]